MTLPALAALDVIVLIVWALLSLAHRRRTARPDRTPLSAAPAGHVRRLDPPYDWATDE